MDKPTLTIGGQDIEYASFDTYTMDEAMVLWDYTKMTLDEIGEVQDFVPGVIAALIHVSFARANPRMHAKQIRKQVGAIPLSELETVFENISEEVDPVSVPPTVAEPPSESSGDGSEHVGELSLVNNPAQPSGPPGSLTSLEDFARVISANSPRDNSTAFSS